MKHIFFIFSVILMLQNFCYSQIELVNDLGGNNKLSETEFISHKLKSVQLIFDKDSINGFNEKAAYQQASLSGAPIWEQNMQVSLMKRRYINTKYNIGSNFILNKTPTVQASCSNVDFETGNTSSWTIQEGINTNSVLQTGCCPNASTRFSVVSPGFDQAIAVLPTVPPGGGNFALKIGDGETAGDFVVRAKQTFAVTQTNALFIFKFAVVLEDGSHDCADQPYFNITFTDASGNPIPCGAYNVTQAGSGCTTGGDPGFIPVIGGTFNLQYFYKPWTTRAFDLTSLIGTNVTVEFTAGDCTAGAHAGWGYVDCSCQPLTLSLNGTNIPVGQTNIIRCNAIGSETLCAAAGFDTYTWTGPGVTGQTGQCINVSAAGSYSVALTIAGGCLKPYVI